MILPMLQLATDSMVSNFTCLHTIGAALTLEAAGNPISPTNQHVNCAAHNLNLGIQAFLNNFKCD